MRSAAANVTVIGFLVVTLGACGEAAQHGDSLRSPTVGGTGSVSGVIVASGGPLTVEGASVQQAASGTPQAHQEVVLKAGDHVVARATTDARGRYTFNVVQGRYLVEAISCPGRATAIVKPGAEVTADINCAIR
jgi:hypothetical protein